MKFIAFVTARSTTSYQTKQYSYVNPYYKVFFIFGFSCLKFFFYSPTTWVDFFQFFFFFFVRLLILPLLLFCLIFFLLRFWLSYIFFFFCHWWIVSVFNLRAQKSSENEQKKKKNTLSYLGRNGICSKCDAFKNLFALFARTHTHKTTISSTMVF